MAAQPSARPEALGRSAIELDRLIYLTGNLDSLSRSFQSKGFVLERGRFNALGVSENFVRLPYGQTIVLQTTNSTDTSDWRVKAIRDYGTHIAGLYFRTRILESVFAAIHSAKTEFIDSDSGRRSFALQHPAPLDVVCTDSPDTLSESHVMHPNGLRRIMWLLLTVSDSTETLLRQTFNDLGIERAHEGCCDYWLLGPPEQRTTLRFELPSTTFRGTGNWLSIEDGGVVFD